ncbi:MAG TPA: hypothetical protein VGT02_16760 [Methylomirabilota bacterium]|nr:hypothetical protein [Methylomirabilota bacterium]
MDRGDLAESLLTRVLALVLGHLVCLAASVASAGHEMPFYPSYYPQEIAVETLPSAVAAERLQKSTVHAWLGPDLWPGRAPPRGVLTVESLASYVVVGTNPASPSLATREGRCTAVRRVIGALRDGPWVPHPYPVTPYHPDHLQHLDLIEGAARGSARAVTAAPAPGLRVRAKGRFAETLVGAHRARDAKWDVVVEEVGVRELVESEASPLHGGLAPPWLKEGWFHAWLLAGASLSDAAEREAAESAVRRLAGGGVEGAAARANVERALVARLSKGCERVVAGYRVRRQFTSDDYSAGVENVAADAHAGLASSIFPRAVKLKDFPWNGWLTVGVSERATAAWNPVAGFTDATGRVLWAALADPALFPEPHGATWVENRVRLQDPEKAPAPGPVVVPDDAVLPEAGTGVLKRVGGGRTAKTRLTYRVLTSNFHDGTSMTTADALYALAFAFKWGGGQQTEGDASVRRATALMREAVVAVRPLRVETDVLRFGEVTMKYEVPIVEVYLDRGLPDPLALAVLAPPWTPVPWHVLALLEEAVKSGAGAFSAEEARRRGVPWLDVVRDARLRDRLRPLLAALEGRAHVPPALQGLVTPREARQRWGKLAQFLDERKHVLVTSGPYELHAWSPTGAVLRVFRNFSYPLGVGSFDRYPHPLHGSITRAEVRADRIEVHAEAERVERFAREHRIVAEPVGAAAVQKERGISVVCRFVIVGPEGAVLRMGSVAPTPAGTFVVTRDGLGRGPHVALLAVSVNGVVVAAAARSVRVE